MKIDIHIDVQNMYSTFLNERLETKWFMASQDLQEQLWTLRDDLNFEVMHCEEYPNYRSRVGC